jgi:hypothetical protein
MENRKGKPKKKIEKKNQKREQKRDRKRKKATKWVGAMRRGMRGASLPRRNGRRIEFLPRRCNTEQQSK